MISLLVPTRGRPDNVRRFLESADENADGEFEAVFYLDKDDPLIGETLEALRETPNRVWHVLGSRIVLSATWTQCARIASGDILGIVADDVVFRTEGWDRLVEHAFAAVPDRILMVHGRDGIHDARFGTHCFVSRRWYEACGELFPGIYASEWVDQHLNDVANALGRRVFLPDLFTEHHHYVNGLAPYDATYADNAARNAAQNTGKVYAENGASRERDIAILRELMEVA